MGRGLDRLFRHEGWVCTWCNRPVIFGPVMKFLEREVRKSGRNERLSYYHAHWTRAGAPLLDELGAAIDHVEAVCGELLILGKSVIRHTQVHDLVTIYIWQVQSERPRFFIMTASEA